MPFLYGEVNGNFFQTLCYILNMCISSLLVMRRNRCAKIGERLLFLCISFVQTKIIYTYKTCYRRGISKCSVEIEERL